MKKLLCMIVFTIGISITTQAQGYVTEWDPYSQSWVVVNPYTTTTGSLSRRAGQASYITRAFQNPVAQFQQVPMNMPMNMPIGMNMGVYDPYGYGNGFWPNMGGGVVINQNMGMGGGFVMPGTVGGNITFPAGGSQINIGASSVPILRRW